jgi:hypothetical protein
LDIDGLVVDRVVRDDAGRRVVHCSTDPLSAAGARPAVSSRRHRSVGHHPPTGRGDRRGSADPVVAQAEMAVPVDSCERKVFTGFLPDQVPARARITARRRAAEAIGDHTRPVSSVAAEFGMDWRIAHDAFVAHASVVMPEAPPPVTVLRCELPNSLVLAHFP